MKYFLSLNTYRKAVASFEINIFIIFGANHSFRLLNVWKYLAQERVKRFSVLQAAGIVITRNIL